MSVTRPDLMRRMQGFLSVAQYPRGFEPHDDEFGLIMLDDGMIKYRLFSVEEE